MNNQPETVKLKNGAEEHKALVATVYMTLNQMVEDNKGILLYELTMKCRDRDHQFFGNSADELEKRGLVMGGRVHDSIRNIVLSAVVGDGAEMALGNPRMPEADVDAADEAINGRR